MPLQYSYTQRLLDMAPGWLKAGQGGLILQALGSRIDHMIEVVEFGLKSASPGLVTYDSLDAIAADRLLRFGASETVANFAIRCKTWRTEHSRRGNAYALLNQLAAFMYPDISPMTLTYRNGLQYSMGTGGTVTRGTTTAYSAVGPAAQWARYWLDIQGNPLANNRIDDIKAIVASWHAEHCLGHGTVINGNRTWDNAQPWDQAGVPWDSPGTQIEWDVNDGLGTPTVITPYDFASIGGADFTLVKNWDFGTTGNIGSIAQLDAEFNYASVFGSFNNGGQYGTNTVATSAATAISGQPVDPTGNRFREFTPTSILCYVRSFGDITTGIGPGNLYNGGNGSLFAKFAYPSGGSDLGKTIAWETRFRIVNPTAGQWFALWTVGSIWDNGPEMDVIESFSAYQSLVSQKWHVNSVQPSAIDHIDYYSGSWEDGQIAGGVHDPANHLDQWHTITWCYHKDNTYSVFWDGNQVQWGTLPWRVGSGVHAGQPTDMHFEFDMGALHTVVTDYIGFTIGPGLLPIIYEIDYSRIFERSTV